jgi:hypothetical protein
MSTLRFWYWNGDELTHSPSDSVSVTDSLSIEVGKAQADSVAVSDAQGLEAGKVLSDSVSVSDAVSTEEQNALSLGDTALVSDSQSLSVGKVLGDSVTVADSITPTLTGGVAPTGGGWIAPRRRPPALRHEMALRDYVLVTDDLEVEAELDPELRQEELAVLLLA